MHSALALLLLFQAEAFAEDMYTRFFALTESLILDKACLDSVRPCPFPDESEMIMSHREMDEMLEIAKLHMAMYSKEPEKELRIADQFRQTATKMTGKPREEFERIIGQIEAASEELSGHLENDLQSLDEVYLEWATVANHMDKLRDVPAHEIDVEEAAGLIRDWNLAVEKIKKLTLRFYGLYGMGEPRFASPDCRVSILGWHGREYSLRAAKNMEDKAQLYQLDLIAHTGKVPQRPVRRISEYPFATDPNLIRWIVGIRDGQELKIEHVEAGPIRKFFEKTDPAYDPEDHVLKVYVQEREDGSGYEYLDDDFYINAAWILKSFFKRYPVISSVGRERSAE